MPYYDYDDLLSDEFGETKKKPKVVLVRKQTPVKVFAANIRQQRQSTNVEDVRSELPLGMNSVTVTGYLTWNTPYHLSMNVDSNIKNALQRYGFNVFGLKVTARDYNNSQYNFTVILLVLSKYSDREIVSSLTNTLSKTVALANSVRVQGFSYNKKSAKAKVTRL